MAARLAITSRYPELAPKDLQILNSKEPEDRGLPYALISNSRKGFLSISHRAPFACAAYSEKTMVGIDLERIEKRDVSFAETFATTHELQYIQSFKVPNKAETLIWSAKEAISKVLGKGLSVSTHDIHLQLPTDLENQSEISWQGSFDGSFFEIKSLINAPIPGFIITLAYVSEG